MQPRTNQFLWHLQTTRADFVDKVSEEYIPQLEGTVIALGLWYGVKDGDTESKLYYR